MRRDGDACRRAQAARRPRRRAPARARVRRDRARLVRRPRRAGRRDAVPRERHARPQRPARAPARRRAPLRALRRRQPDQRPEPRADRGARARAARARHRPAGLLRQPQLASVPHRHDAADARRRRRPRARGLHVGVQLVLGLPPVPRGSLQRAAGGRARRARGAASCGCSSTTRASSRRTSTACAPRMPELGTGDVHIAFTAHSIPVAMAANCAYEAQLAEAARLVAEAVGVADWAVVYQSRSGPPQVPWLEPDIGDHLRDGRRARRAGRRRSRRSASSPTTSRCSSTSTSRRGRSPTSSAWRWRAPARPARIPRSSRVSRDLIVERLTPGAERPALGRFGPSHDVCAPDCCLPGNGPAEPLGRGLGADARRARRAGRASSRRRRAPRPSARARGSGSG